MEKRLTAQDVSDDFDCTPRWRGRPLVFPPRCAETQVDVLKVEATPARKDFLTIPEIAARWRIARPTVYNRLRDAGLRVLDFADKGARGRKIVPFGAILEIERQQLKRL